MSNKIMFKSTDGYYLQKGDVFWTIDTQTYKMSCSFAETKTAKKGTERFLLKTNAQLRIRRIRLYRKDVTILLKKFNKAMNNEARARFVLQVIIPEFVKEQKPKYQQ